MLISFLCQDYIFQGVPKEEIDIAGELLGLRLLECPRSIDDLPKPEPLSYYIDTL